MPNLIAQAPGDAGVQQTVAYMRALVNAAITDPVIRRQGFLATQHCPRQDHGCKCYSVLAWVKRHLHYLADPRGVEALHDPKLIATAIHTGRVPYGDCDDFAMYTAALLKSIGLAPAFRVIGHGPQFSHVYVVCHGLTLDGTREEWRSEPMAPGCTWTVPV